MNVGVILARFQPIHNGHVELIAKACRENDKVVLLIGSSDKLNPRNPIPVYLREQLVKETISEKFSKEDQDKILIKKLPDLSDESDNSLDWGFYVYSNVVDIINQSYFTIYYSDGYEIITSWFPKFLLRNFVSMSLLARSKVENGVSATEVRNCILNEKINILKSKVPNCVYNMKDVIKAYIEVQEMTQ